MKKEKRKNWPQGPQCLGHHLRAGQGTLLSPHSHILWWSQEPKLRAEPQGSGGGSGAGSRYCVTQLFLLPHPSGCSLRNLRSLIAPFFLYQDPASLGKGLWLSYGTLTQVENQDQQNILKWLEARVGMVDVHGRNTPWSIQETTRNRRLEIQSHHITYQRACVISLSGQEQCKCALEVEGCATPKEEPC